MRRTLLAAICGLVLALPLIGSAPATAADSLGTATARDQVLKPGCHAYPFKYRVTPPPHTTTWLSEISVFGPGGRKVAAAAFLSPADPTSGKSAFKMCRTTIVPGTYTIRMKLTFIDIYDVHITKAKPTKFRLTRR